MDLCRVVEEEEEVGLLLSRYLVSRQLVAVLDLFSTRETWLRSKSTDRRSIG